MSESDAAPLTRRDAEEALRSIWSEVLRLSELRIGLDDSFFLLGGDSLRMTEIMERVNSRFFAGRREEQLPITAFFAHSTVRALARRIVLGSGEAGGAPRLEGLPANAVAIVGMAGRFPGAADIAALWEILRNGIESIRELSEQELRESGVETADIEHPDYIRRGAPIEQLDRFDSEYFGLTPREAELTPPEQRVLLACAEEALQDAGYGTREDGDRVGVFVGARAVPAWSGSVRCSAVVGNSTDVMRLALNTSPATRISYLLNLTGPSLSIDTACSSSLVAVHQACRSLINGECELALAGGVSSDAATARGYRYEEGGIQSSDGHCRPFDRDASGTVFTAGAGFVVLKAYARARADMDSIYAVIKGTAINNDGREKVGYTAPSVLSQTAVIRQALDAAGVDAATVDFVETHGTGTRVGDQIELEALRGAFESGGPRAAPCVLGALKANIGHLEAAAGIAGLIKAALVLHHRRIPPLAALRAPLDVLAATKLFEANHETRDWRRSEGLRRAGVSSFGIGGTNAHAVLEEETPLAEDAESRNGTSVRCVLPLSARSLPALRASCRQLAAYLRADGAAPLEDIAYTLQAGRRHHAFRRTFFCATHEEAAAQLEGHAEADAESADAGGTEPAVFFWLPHQSEDDVRTLMQLYDREPRLRKAARRCVEALAPESQATVHLALESAHESTRPATSGWQGPDGRSLARVGLVLSCALARLWRSWGAEPEAFICSGNGRLAAVCMSGMLDLEGALRLADALKRMQSSGDRPARIGLAADLERTAFSEKGVAPILAGTGSSLTASDLRRAEQWIAAVKQPEEAPRAPRRDAVILEIAASEHGLLDAAAALWQRGVSINWLTLARGRRAKRVHLPTYPFERRPPPLAWRADVNIPPATGTARASSLVTANAPRTAGTDVEAELIRIWRELLGVEVIATTDDFFDLGGDSLLVMHLAEKVAAVFDRDVPIRELTERSTIRGIASYLRTPSETARRPTIPT